MITFSPAIPLAQAAVAAASIGCILATDRRGGAVIQPAEHHKKVPAWKPWFAWPTTKDSRAVPMDEGE